MHSADVPTLADLLSPIDLDTFLSEYWEKKPLHVRGPERNFDALLSLADLDTILAYTFAPNVAPYATAHASSPQPQMEPASFTKPLERLRAGETVLIGSLHLRWPPIAVLCRETRATLRHPVGATSVLTPGREHGLALHYDLPSVLVMQLHGEKEWQLYEPLDDKPMSIRPLAEAEVEGLPYRSIWLRPGDVLYVPRGLPHRCYSGDGPSLHLSMYIDVLTWKDLLAQVLDVAAAGDARLRQALPPGLVGGDQLPPAIGDEFRNLLRQVMDQASAEAAVERLTTSFIASMPQLPGGTFSEVFDAHRVEAGTQLEKRPGSICHVREMGLTAEIQYPGGALAAPMYLLPALRFIAAAGGPFAAGDLPELPENDQLVLVRRLIREGLLRVSKG